MTLSLSGMGGTSIFSYGKCTESLSFFIGVVPGSIAHPDKADFGCAVWFAGYKNEGVQSIVHEG